MGSIVGDREGGGYKVRGEGYMYERERERHV
jgi:hypothetical protein